jgi:hypothetical protein
MDLATLKASIISRDPNDFVREIIFSAHCVHIEPEGVRYIRVRLSEAVGIDIRPEEMVVVGSAKIGFGLFEKKRRDGDPLPRFRPFGPESDIDVAICSPELFDTVWKELCDYAIGKPWLPYIMRNTGNYLVYGWLRPDQVPLDARLRTLDKFQDRRREISNTAFLKRRKISVALYRDASFLYKYQTRAIAQCRKELLEQ